MPVEINLRTFLSLLVYIAASCIGISFTGSRLGRPGSVLLTLVGGLLAFTVYATLAIIMIGGEKPLYLAAETLMTHASTFVPIISLLCFVQFLGIIGHHASSFELSEHD